MMSVIDDVQAGLAGVPRIELGVLPTALHRASRLSEELGVPVWLKRDDLTGLGLGGNKIRALEYLLADALAQDCDCLVTGAGPQSNWTMLAALAAARLSLDAFVVCYGDPGSDDGNLLLHRRIGTAVSFTGNPDRASVNGAVDEVGRQLRDQGRRPYVVPRGGATPVGALGYLRASVEIAAQLSPLTAPPESIWLAAGSGGTCAGLVAGAALLPAFPAVVGVTVSRPREEITEQVTRLASGATALIDSFAYRVPGHAAADTGGSAHQVGKDGSPAFEAQVDIRDGWIGAGYGVPSADGEDAAALVARTEGIFLDPIFGAKAMAALISACRSGQVRGPVAFLVSGGAPTLFAGLVPG